MIRKSSLKKPMIWRENSQTEGYIMIYYTVKTLFIFSQRHIDHDDIFEVNSLYKW